MNAYHAFLAMGSISKKKSELVMDLIVDSYISELSICMEMDTRRFGKSENLMPRDIKSSEQRHWMVCGQLVRSNTTQAWPTGQMTSREFPLSEVVSLGIRSSAALKLKHPS